MRKEQEKLIHRAQRNNYSVANIKILSNESFTIRELQSVYYFLYNFRTEVICLEDIVDILNRSYALSKALNAEITSEYNAYKSLFILDMFSYNELIGTDRKKSFEDVRSTIIDVVDSAEMNAKDKQQYLSIYRFNDEENISTKDVYNLLKKYSQNDCKLDVEEIINSIVLFNNKFDTSLFESIVKNLLTNEQLCNLLTEVPILRKGAFVKVYVFSYLNGITDKEFIKSVTQSTDDCFQIIKWTVAKNKFPRFFKYLDKNCFKNEKKYNGFVPFLYLPTFENSSSCSWCFLDENIISLLKEMMDKAISDRKNAEYSNLKQIALNADALKVTASVSYSGISFCFTKGTSYSSNIYENVKFVNGIEELEPYYANLYIKWQSKDNAFSIFFPYNENNIFVKSKKTKNKYIPADIRLFKKFLFSSTISNDVLRVLLEEYMNKRIKDGCYIYKDLLPYIRSNMYECKDLPPVKISDVEKYSANLDVLMKSVYKTADFVNWNKCNLVYSYSLMKIKSKITKKSWDYLQNGITNSSNNMPFSIYNFIYKRVSENKIAYSSTNHIYGDALHYDISDYLSMCKKLKRKINLLHTSSKKIREEHDELARLYREKHTPVIKIPKQSKFLPLRKLLPEDFEWIKTKRRICEEGAKQRNCVATYASDVNSDRCAIYSLVRDGNRYTIEFRKSNGKYYIEQMFGVSNSETPEEVYEYANSFVTQGVSA